MSPWFTRDWWRYLLAPREWGHVSWPRTILCRLRGHPAGVYWYSSGFEPDMHCKECGDDLG
jgi:hypothetical protein